MRTGSLATTTGLYRSECSCASTVRIDRGEDAPACPSCRRQVGWLYLRSEYVPARGDDLVPDAGPVAPNGVEDAPGRP
jgi:hypothetical protein